MMVGRGDVDAAGSAPSGGVMGGKAGPNGRAYKGHDGSLEEAPKFGRELKWFLPNLGDPPIPSWGSKCQG